MKKQNLNLLFKMAKNHFMFGFAIPLYPFFWLFDSSYLITDYVKILNLELKTLNPKNYEKKKQK